jgi:hypothetical protein
MGFFDLFKKKKTRTAMDEVNELVVKSFRGLAESNGVAPTSKMSDEEIIRISQEVGEAFRKVSEQRGEHLKAGYLFTIQMQFFRIYELSGEKLYQEHIIYECNKYLNEGLRQDYQQDLKLFG